MPIKSKRQLSSPVTDQKSIVVSITTTVMREDYNKFTEIAHRLGLTRSALLRKLVEDEIRSK